LALSLLIIVVVTTHLAKETGSGNRERDRAIAFEISFHVQLPQQLKIMTTEIWEISGAKEEAKICLGIILMKYYFKIY